MGLSGVGKTRFVQAMFESDVGLNSLPASDVIYADLGNDLTPTASELLVYLIANRFTTYVVLDNCPPDVHRSLQRQVASSGACLRLLTIEYDISDDKPEETVVIYLEPSSEEMVARLVQKRIPGIGAVNAERIAEFAGGNARVAIALASQVGTGESLSNFSDEDLFRRLFMQRKGDSSSLLQSAEALALVYSFNASRAEGDELGGISAVAGIARQTLYKDQAELLRRQLAQSRGNWRAILPHALANRLAKRALENIPPEDINAELFKPGNVRLLQSCAHRLGYLHDIEAAQRLAATWLEPALPLADIATCSESGLVVWEFLAPLFPEVVLRAIKRAAHDRRFASRQNAHFVRFVRLLCRLAYEDEHFDCAVGILLLFAEGEAPGENNHSVVEQMRRLFSVRLSGTEATPLRRQAFIGKLLGSGIPRHMDIARELCRSAFETRSWTSVGTFHFGARKRGPGWSPDSHTQQTAWYVDHIKLLESGLRSGVPSTKEAVKSILAAHFRSLCWIQECLEVLEPIVREHAAGGRWPAMWMSIKKALHFASDRHSADMLDQIRVLERLAAPADTYAEIEAYVLVDVWEHAELRGIFSDSAHDIFERAQALGELVATEPQHLDRLGTRLWHCNAQPLFQFGKGLARGSSNVFETFSALIGSFQKHQTEQSNPQLLSGFISGVHDSEDAVKMLQSIVATPGLSSFSVSMLTAVPISPPLFQTLLTLAKEGEIEAWRFEHLGHGSGDALSDADMAKLLAEINELKQGYLSTIWIVHMRLNRSRGMPLSEEIRRVAWSAIYILVSQERGERGPRQRHGIELVLDATLTPDAPEQEVRQLIYAFCDGIRSRRLYAFESREITSALAVKYPEWLLDEMFNGSEGELDFARELFSDSVSMSDEPTLNCVPVERILSWCRGDEGRIMKIANTLTAYVPTKAVGQPQAVPDSVTLSTHAKSLFDAARDKRAFVEILFDRVHPDSWSGSLADIFDARSRAFAELLEVSDTELRALVGEKLALLKLAIVQLREKENSINSEREQRFE